MTNTNDPIAAESLADARDRRIAYWAQAMREPMIMPDAPARRLPPRTRNRYRRRRAIR